MILETVLISARSQTVADAQKQAIVKYPDLGREGSPINTEFRSLYTTAKESDPILLSNPNWPLVLADRASAAVRKTRSALPTPAPAPRPRVVARPGDKDLYVELDSTPIEGRATWVMSRCATYFLKYKGDPPTIMPEFGFYIRADPPLHVGTPFSRWNFGLRISDDEIGKATELLKKFQDWIQVAKKNNVKETRKTIGSLDGGIGEREFGFDVHSDETSTTYSLLIRNRDLEKHPLSATDVSAILELLGRTRSVEAVLKDRVLHFDRPEKDPLFK